MIALIALFALTAVIGVAIGIVAIVIALIKSVQRGISRHHTTELHGVVNDPVSEQVTPQRATDHEFMRLISTEWPSATDPN